MAALKNQSCESRRITSKEYNVITVKPEGNELGFVGTPTKINKGFLSETKFFIFLCDSNYIIFSRSNTFCFAGQIT